MFSAISGLKTQQVMLDVAANDLANVNTVGFKASRTTFKDALQQTFKTSSASGAGVGGTNAAQVGLGVTLGTVDNLMTGGAVQATGNALDVAIQGDGWFRAGPGNPVAGGDPTVGTPATAQTTYTRAGNLTRSDTGFLETANGDYIVGRTAPGGTTDCYISIPAGASDFAVASDGAVSFVPPAGYTQPAMLPPMLNGRAIAGYISLAKFPNENGLERLTNNRWRAGANAGAPAVGTPGQNGVFGTTTAGAIEMSNVDLATEFTAMITAQRGFQANSRVISTADQMLQDLVNLNR
jgi:flagellar hook protein FlgE